MIVGIAVVSRARDFEYLPLFEGESERVAKPKAKLLLLVLDYFKTTIFGGWKGEFLNEVLPTTVYRRAERKHNMPGL
jgi:hypothetical protein